MPFCRLLRGLGRIRKPSPNTTRTWSCKLLMQDRDESLLTVDAAKSMLLDTHYRKGDNPALSMTWVPCASIKLSDGFEPQSLRFLLGSARISRCIWNDIYLAPAVLLGTSANVATTVKRIRMRERSWQSRNIAMKLISGQLQIVLSASSLVHQTTWTAWNEVAKVGA